MTVQIFLSLLLGFSTLSGIITEFVKQFFKDNDNASYNLIAVIVGMGVGIGGTYVYYILSNLTLEPPVMLISVLMGIGAALTSMVGYDKIKQLIIQLTEK